MIDGLKLTMTGDQIRTRLDARIQHHREESVRWRQEASSDGDTPDAIQLPAHMCEHEAARHQWRAEVLTFIRDHADVCEIYRLTAADLEFAELLPEPPPLVEQAEHEEHHELSMQIRRLARSIEGLPFGLPQDPDFTLTRIDTQGGPEIVQVERK